MWATQQALEAILFCFYYIFYIYVVINVTFGVVLGFYRIISSWPILFYRCFYNELYPTHIGFSFNVCCNCNCHTLYQTDEQRKL